MRFIFLCSLFLFHQISAACPIQTELTEKMKSSADAVFVGKAVEYKPPVKFGRPAIIRFKVTKMIAGVPREEFKVFWVNGTFGYPRKLAEFLTAYGPETRVGIVLPESNRKDPNISWYPVKGYPNLPWVLQGGCTPPFMDKEAKPL